MDLKDYQDGLNQNYFWFKGKRDLIRILLNQINLNKNCKILNVGAGTGEDLGVIKEFGAIYAIDINQEALNFIPNEFVHEKKVMDVCDIRYPDGFFDVVLAFDVLEHINNDSKAVLEISRVLKKDGGIFIFTVPAFNFMYSAHDEKLGHVRRYNKKMIKKLMSEHFDFMHLRYWLCLLFPTAFIQRMFSKIFIKHDKNNLSECCLPVIVDKMFYRILNFENFLISKKIKFPFGLTLYGVCKIKK